MPSRNAGAGSGTHPFGRQALVGSAEKTGGIRPGISFILAKPRHFIKLGGGRNTLALEAFFASVVFAVADDVLFWFISEPPLKFLQRSPLRLRSLYEIPSPGSRFTQGLKSLQKSKKASFLRLFCFKKRLFCLKQAVFDVFFLLKAIFKMRAA